MLQGTVYQSTGSHYHVRFEGRNIVCRLRGKLRLEEQDGTNPVAVGDLVNFSLDLSSKPNRGIIESIHPRQNKVIRKATKLSKKEQIIASNIDQVILVITLNQPKTYTTFIDRCLVGIESLKLKCILLFNKIDLLNQFELSKFDDLKNIYHKIGYDTISISALKGTNFNLLKSLLQNKVTLLSGNSGVGKSTIINQLCPTLNLKTNSLSTKINLGKHTTRRVQLFELDNNTKIIDAPGIKGFGLVETKAQQVKNYFRDFAKLSNTCAYHNCMHLDEPDCGVMVALAKKKIAPSRYKSYLSILEKEQKYR